MESEQDQTLAQRQALEAAIEQCQKALKLLKRNGSQGDSDGQFSLCHDSEIDEVCVNRDYIFEGFVDGVH
jgi:hypothetical protein